MLHLLPLLALASAPGVPGAPAAPPNLVLILADDLGVDLLAAYGEGAAPPCTPNLDQLAAGGLLFRNAWASPVCTPSRAQILTGRYGFRTGGGGNQPGTGLPLDETTLPEMLSGYSSAALGKWGVGSGLGSSHPNDSGFDHYAGGIGGGLSDYFSWSKTTNGTSATSATYATSDTADEAILAAQSLPQPWFLYVSFNAPHTRSTSRRRSSAPRARARRASAPRTRPAAASRSRPWSRPWTRRSGACWLASRRSIHRP